MRLSSGGGGGGGGAVGVEGSNPIAKRTESGVHASSADIHDDGLFSSIGATGLAIACACTAAALIVFVGTFLWLKNRRRRQRLLKELTFDGYDESKITKSAPNSRLPSPRPGKRMSCPDALSSGHRRSGSSVLVKSLTCDPILDSSMPPECVQPKIGQDPNVLNRQDSADSKCYTAISLDSPLADRTQYSFDEEKGEMSIGTHGRIWFSTFYDKMTKKLNVNLIKVNDLPKREGDDESRDPFVKIYLLPDERTCQVSKYKKNTTSPIFNELHTFQVLPEEVKSRVLRLSVYDMDKRRVRHSLGHIMVNLSDMDLDRGDVVCSNLEGSVQSNACLGDIQLSLAYIPAREKIKIGIHKARKLQVEKERFDKGAYVKIQLFYGHKCHRIKRTVTRSLTENCPFEESLTFTVQGRQLESCSLVLSVMVTYPAELSKQDFEYGKMVIGPFMYARGDELLHWQEMVSHPKQVTTRWHSLVNNNTFESRGSQ